MAAGLLQQIVAQRGDADSWQIQSAGTWAAPGLPATQYSQMVMARQGIDLTAHRSRLVDGELLRQTDIILVMTRNHQEALQVEFPEMAAKVHLVSQLVDQTFDIEDPYGGPLDEYELCAADLRRILVDGYDRLREWANRSP